MSENGPAVKKYDLIAFLYGCNFFTEDSKKVHLTLLVKFDSAILSLYPLSAKKEKKCFCEKNIFLTQI